LTVKTVSVVLEDWMWQWP